MRNAHPGFGVGRIDERLIRGAAVSTFSQETVGADGGFTVPADFRSAILSKVFSEDSLVSRTDRLQSSSNTITIPVDMTTPWQTSGGTQAFWVAEAAVKTQSKVVLEQISVKLNNLAVLMPVTEELLEDSPGLMAISAAKFQRRWISRSATAWFLARVLVSLLALWLAQR